jgi:parallel beta-helix repeat protein
MEGKIKNRRVLIGSVSIASTLVLITLSIGPSLLLDREEPLNINNTLNWDIIVPDHYGSIQKAIENAEPGYQIFVRNGSYRTSENFFNRPIVINKPGITIQGENKNNTIINGRNIKNIIFIEANYVNLSGFTIKDYGVNGSSIIINSNHCIINDNILIGEDHYDGIEYCIRIYQGSNNIISNNTIFGTDNGIELSLCNENLIENNIFINNYNGIELENILYLDRYTNPKISWRGCTGNIFQNNFFTNNIYGISCYGSSDNFFINNTFNSNRESGLYLTACSHENIKNNTFIKDGLVISGNEIDDYFHVVTGNLVNGKPLYYFTRERIIKVPNDAGQIILVDCDYSIIEKVIITETSIAVLVAFSSNVRIKNSEFSSNSMGVFLKYSTDCSIQRNNFINNFRDASFEVKGFLNRKSNKWRFNYWDSWIGLRRPFFRFFNKRIYGRYHVNFLLFDMFGFGRIVKNIDRFPQKTPYVINN